MHSFWTKYLEYISIFFVMIGLMWALIGSFDPFGIYDSMMAKSFFGNEELNADVKRVLSFILAPFGATSAGYFILQYFISKNAFAEKKKWAYNSIASAFIFWFVVDSVMSAIHGAFFNIAIANITTLLFMLPPLIFTRKNFK